MKKFKGLFAGLFVVVFIIGCNAEGRFSGVYTNTNSPSGITEKITFISASKAYWNSSVYDANDREELEYRINGKELFITVLDGNIQYNFKIIDKNTLEDEIGDIWKKQ